MNGSKHTKALSLKLMKAEQEVRVIGHLLEASKQLDAFEQKEEEIKKVEKTKPR